MTDVPFTLHHTIEAATRRATDKATGDDPETVYAMIRLYVEEDVQAWITAQQQAAPTACQATNANYPDAYSNDVHRYPCILPLGHDPIAPAIDRSHIDRDGDTW